MKRFHVHAHVESIPASIAFYSKLFDAAPARVESDYAKWMLDDPRINFAISTRGGGRTGVDHLGLQTDSDAELADLKDRAAAAGMTLQDVGETVCCYARSDKYWLTDPQGIAWEQFHTLGNIPVFGAWSGPVAGIEVAAGAESGAETAPAAASGCCAPRAAVPVTDAASVAAAAPVRSSPSCC